MHKVVLLKITHTYAFELFLQICLVLVFGDSELEFRIVFFIVNVGWVSSAKGKYFG